MLRPLIISIFLFPGSISNCFCQGDGKGLVQFEDTLNFFAPKTETIASLKVIKGKYWIVDTLTAPEGYILNGLSLGHNFALKKGNGYTLIPISKSVDENIDSIRSIDFGEGDYKKLVVYSSSDIGNSGGDSTGNWGWREYGKSIEIWDLQKIICLLSFQYYFSSIHWDNGPDVSSVNNECDNFLPLIGKNEIVFEQQGKCNDFEEKINVDVSASTPVKYKVTPYGLVKVK